MNDTKLRVARRCAHVSRACQQPRTEDASQTALRKLRVLVVDAEQDTANDLLRQVRHAGHDGHATVTCRAALQAAAIWYPDVVLMDMETSRVGEFHVAKLMRSECLDGDHLIVAFANGIDDSLYERSVDAGIDLLLKKPADPDVVATLLMLECVRVNQRRSQELGDRLSCRMSTNGRVCALGSRHDDSILRCEWTSR